MTLLYALEDDADKSKVAEILRKRLALLEVKGEVEVQEDGRRAVRMPEEIPGQELARIDRMLTRPGTLEFRIVAPDEALRKARQERELDPAAPPPSGTEWLPGRDGKEWWLLEIPREARDIFGKRDLALAVTVLMREGTPSEYTAIRFEITEDRKKEFRDFTRRHIGRKLAMVIDGAVESAPVIMEMLPGCGMISGGRPGGFTREEAEELAFLLSAPSLPVRIMKVKEER